MGQFSQGWDLPGIFHYVILGQAGMCQIPSWLHPGKLKSLEEEGVRRERIHPTAEGLHLDQGQFFSRQNCVLGFFCIRQKQILS